MEPAEALDQFLAVYEQMRPVHWREPAIESRPRSEKRVLALARGFHPHGRWEQALAAYFASYRLALRTAASMPVFGGRSTCWTVAGPDAVRRLSGALSVGPRDLMRWEEQVLWLRLEPEGLAVLRAAAAALGRSAPGLAAELLEAALDDLATDRP